MTNRIRISVQFRPEHATYDTQRKKWVDADAMGVDLIGHWDHFYPLYGDPDGLHFESWTMLAGMAEVTRHAQIGHFVTCNSYRNPNLLADMARTVDHISGGRVFLGIGAGWFKRDYDEYGFDFDTAPERLRALKRDLPIIRERWQKLNPAPVQGTIPLLIGGGGEKVTLRIVAEHADIWHALGSMEQIAHKQHVLNNWCDRVARDPASIERCTTLPDGDIDQADALVDLGFTNILLSVAGEDTDLAPLESLLHWRDQRNQERLA